jgi:hypothetical protein
MNAKEFANKKAFENLSNLEIVSFPFREKKTAIQFASAIEHYLYRRPFSQSFKVIGYKDIDSGKYTPSCKGVWYWIVVYCEGGKEKAGRKNVKEITKETEIIADAIDVLYRADLSEFKKDYPFDLVVNSN